MLEEDVHLLHLDPARTGGAMDHDLVHEFQDHLVGQHRKIRVSLGQEQELLRPIRVLVEDGQGRFVRFQSLLQLPLLALVGGGDLLVPLQGDALESVILVELHGQPVQLVDPLLSLVHPLADGLGVGSLLQGGGLSDPMQELRPVLDGEGGRDADGVQRQGAQDLGSDVVGKALLVLSAGADRVLPALVGVRGQEPRYGVGGEFMPLVLRHAPVVVHLAAAVRAENQPREHVGLAGGVGAADGLADLLHGVEGALVNEGFVGVLDDLPLAGVAVHLLALVGLLVRPVVHGVAKVLRPREHLRHRPGGPVVGPVQVRGVKLQAVSVHIVGGALDPLLPELLGDDGGAVALQGQSEHLPHHRRRFLIDEQMMLFVRVLFISIQHLVGEGDVRPAPCLVGLLLLAAGVPEVPLVHDVEEGGELTALLVRAVHAVGDGDEADPMLPEKNFGIKAGLQIVPAHPAHVLDEDGLHLPRFDVRHQPLPVRALEIAAGIAVVGVMGPVQEAMLLGIVLQYPLLRDDRVAVPQLFVVPGETLIERGDGFFLRRPDAHVSILSGCRRDGCGASSIPRSWPMATG